MAFCLWCTLFSLEFIIIAALQGSAFGLAIGTILCSWLVSNKQLLLYHINRGHQPFSCGLFLVRAPMRGISYSPDCTQNAMHHVNLQSGFNVVIIARTNWAPSSGYSDVTLTASIMLQIIFIRTSVSLSVMLSVCHKGKCWYICKLLLNIYRSTEGTAILIV